MEMTGSDDKAIGPLLTDFNMPQLNKESMLHIASGGNSGEIQPVLSENNLL